MYSRITKLTTGANGKTNELYKKYKIADLDDVSYAKFYSKFSLSKIINGTTFSWSISYLRISLRSFVFHLPFSALMLWLGSRKLSVIVDVHCPVTKIPVSSLFGSSGICGRGIKS